MSAARERRRRGQPDELSVPDFRAAGEAPRPREYEAALTVHRRRRAYVTARVSLRLAEAATGRRAAYALEGRVVSPWRRTVDGRAMPPLGRAQKAAGAKALLELQGRVRDALREAGWRLAVPIGALLAPRAQETWQAPEGETLDRRAKILVARDGLRRAAGELIDAVLDGAPAAERRVMLGRSEVWRVWAEAHRGGILLRAERDAPDETDRAQAQAEAEAGARGWAEQAELAREEEEALMHAEAADAATEAEGGRVDGDDH